MSYISVDLRRAVIARAANRCEYCGLSQQGQAATFHVDHVIPLSNDGPTTLENLALACVACSLFKGARQEGVDPQTGEEALLFSPRRQAWDEHFRWGGSYGRNNLLYPLLAKIFGNGNGGPVNGPSSQF